MILIPQRVVTVFNDIEMITRFLYFDQASEKDFSFIVLRARQSDDINFNDSSSAYPFEKDLFSHSPKLFLKSYLTLGSQHQRRHINVCILLLKYLPEF